MTTPASSRRVMLGIAILSVAGVAVSSLSLYHHFGTSKTAFCDLGQSFNCDLVNRSIYSTVAGVPVALIGVLGYLAVLSFATVYRDKAETPLILAMASLAGLGFSLRLTYIEAHVLGIWCLLCLSSLAVIFTLAILSVGLAVTRLRRA